MDYAKAQEHQSAGRWREARDAYHRAGAVRSAQEMRLRHLESLEDELVSQMLRAIAAREESESA